MALSTTIWSRSFRITPGYNDGFSFLPNPKQSKEFAKKKFAKSINADEFFIKKYLAGRYFRGYDEERLEELDYEQLLGLYNAAIEDNNDIHNINKNAWLASLVHISFAQEKHAKRLRKWYMVVYALFTLSMICIALAYWF